MKIEEAARTWPFPCCFLPPPLPLSSWTGGDITSPLEATRRWRTASHRLGGWCQPRMQGHGGMGGTPYIPWWRASRLLPWLTHSQRAASFSSVCPPPRLHLPHKVALVYHPAIGCAIWAAAGSRQLPLHRRGSIPSKRQRAGCTRAVYRSCTTATEMSVKRRWRRIGHRGRSVCWRGARPAAAAIFL